MRWFNNFITISGLCHEGYKGVTFGMLEDKNTGKILMDFYNKPDLGFDDTAIAKKPFNPKELPGNMPEGILKNLVTDLEGAFKIDIKTIYKKFDSKDKLL